MEHTYYRQAPQEPSTSLGVGHLPARPTEVMLFSIYLFFTSFLPVSSFFIFFSISLPFRIEKPAERLNRTKNLTLDLTFFKSNISLALLFALENCPCSFHLIQCLLVAFYGHTLQPM